MMRPRRVCKLVWTMAALVVMPLAGCQESHVPSSAQAAASVAPSGDAAASPRVKDENPVVDAAAVQEQSNPIALDASPPAEPSADSPADVSSDRDPPPPTPRENPAAEPDDSQSAPAAAAPAAAELAPAAPPAAEVVDDGPPRDVTFDTIKFDMEKEDPYDRALIGPAIEALSGKNIKIRGYILPASVFKQTGITGFVLVRDNMECCFGPGAALFDCIVVQMKPGKTTDFTVRPVAVEGTFKIEELENPIEPDGNPIAIYHLDGEGVE